jgi:diguanylate cyclase (GGDEF)-like protein/PAS domain S-box-containing protein
MSFENILYKLKELEIINYAMVNTLYSFTRKNIFILFGLALLTTLLLYPVVKYKILYWFLLVFILLLIRLYSTYIYSSKHDMFTLHQWYMIYLLFAFFTAFIFSSLSFLFISEVDFYYQLLIITILLGLASGAVTALSTDFRLAIVYLAILLFPLMGTIVMTNTSTNYILVFALLLYFVAQVGMIIRTYQHEMEFSVLQSEQDVLHHLFKEAPLAIFMYDNRLNIIECNEQFLTLFGNDRESMIGLNLNNIPDNKPKVSLKKALLEGAQVYKGPYSSISGNKFWIEAKIFPYKNKLNDTVGSIVLIEDKSNEHRIQSELEYLAEHDVLTGLLNRRGLRNLMENVINDVKHESYYSLLFYLDLNQFKGINDSLGHTIGDAVLLNVSQRLKYSLGVDCYISRLGGDEFIIIFPYVSEDLNSAKDEAQKHVNYIKTIFDEPFIIEDLHLHIRSSIGIVMIEPKYQNIEEIIRHADITMYHAKNANGNISYYNVDLDKKQKELFGLQHDLAYAVDKNQFDLFYQPIVTIKDEKLYSAEALIRWNHPEKGLLTPDAFIPLAIKAGLLSKITWWVLDEVCQHIAEWKKFGLWSLEYVSINVNAQQLIENNFADEFLKKLELYGLETKDIVVEITERSLIDNFDSTQNVINSLREHGVRCAIDDFGVGYSSLSYLKKLSFHTLKIDKEFIKDIESNPKELLLVSTILDIGRQFNYNIVIEGVEDKKQKDLLLGLDEGLSYQGYYFSKALPADEFREKFLY